MAEVRADRKSVTADTTKPIIKKGGVPNLGLSLVPIPGGLYKVKNMDGGSPPENMKGFWNDLHELSKKIEQYNAGII